MQRHRRMVLAAAAALTFGVAACSSNASPAASAGDASPDNPLIDCRAVTDAEIGVVVDASASKHLIDHTSCTWHAQGPDGATDISFTWSRHATLWTAETAAKQQGYTTEPVDLQHGSGFYARNPHDADECKLAAEDQGVVTWGVRDENRDVRPDPCNAALQLTNLTVKADY
ncbi:DUF3558 family protein [Antrihabitans cavernicola]|uniref:DUF3558 domain-containing protein n=1 Tax=Antrihabitans cavernicola TaxID=2495913 RepID=A0A5A7S215_9NOCA|nr:DUF3558 family protein [Spelaeibacter cavernicola]KAA0016770.1 DUF3558 domain-containing protein [Spelaeibacter cavernicola]